MTEAKPKTSAGKWHRGYSERRFAVLLVILIMLLVGPPILFGFGMSGGLFDGVMSLLTLAAILSLCFEPGQRVFALLLGIPTIVFSLGGHALSGNVAAGVLLFGHLCEVLFLFGAAALIVKSLLNNRSIAFDSIFGAVCGYLFLGLGWAVLYSMIEVFQPGSFQIDASLVTAGNPSQMFPHLLTYYSFVTLTTVGYGDISPISPITRTLSWMEAISGQFYLAVIVAGLVSMLATKKVSGDETRK